MESARASAEQTYQDGLAEYKQGVADYREQKTDAERQLADSRRQLEDAQQQIADAGTACGAPDAFICVIPLFAICAEHQHHRRTRNERLMVAAVCQCSFQRVVRNIQNCVELLASGARRLHGSRKDCLFHRGRNRFVRIGAHGFARIQAAQNIICITIHIYLLLNELYMRNLPSTFRK